MQFSLILFVLNALLSVRDTDSSTFRPSWRSIYCRFIYVPLGWMQAAMCHCWHVQKSYEKTAQCRCFLLGWRDWRKPQASLWRETWELWFRRRYQTNSVWLGIRKGASFDCGAWMRACRAIFDIQTADKEALRIAGLFETKTAKLLATSLPFDDDTRSLPVDVIIQLHKIDRRSGIAKQYNKSTIHWCP